VLERGSLARAKALLNGVGVLGVSPRSLEDVGDNFDILGVEWADT